MLRPSHPATLPGLQVSPPLRAGGGVCQSRRGMCAESWVFSRAAAPRSSGEVGASAYEGEASGVPQPSQPRLWQKRGESRVPDMLGL